MHPSNCVTWTNFFYLICLHFIFISFHSLSRKAFIQHHQNRSFKLWSSFAFWFLWRLMMIKLTFHRMEGTWWYWYHSIQVLLQCKFLLNRNGMESNICISRFDLYFCLCNHLLVRCIFTVFWSFIPIFI